MVMCIIGAEYLIALGLMRALHSGRTWVSLPDLFELGCRLQDSLNAACVDAVVVRHCLVNVAESFSVFFTVDSLDGVNIIKCSPGVTLSDLQSRFLGYLPFPVLEILQEYSVAA